MLDLVPQLNHLHIILASASPRRKELLERLGLKFIVQPSNFDEDLDKSSFPDAAAYNVATASGKLDDVRRQLVKDGVPHDIVITCDTIVVPCDDLSVILEKANTSDDASRMIHRLAGKSHFVYSALVVYFAALDRTVVRIVQTEVEMAPVSAATVAAYVAHPEAWKGKAGAYGIQDLASSFIRGIKGDYYNVMGFPVCTFCEMLQETIAAHPEILSTTQE
ncbi:maf protein, putative [Bodo saltans]|uniref:Maf protein, putative n=1 Tax=Bodo saltans TaxID=75058 RepID=A0A0S4J6Z6_BODSA|nr:maf protein, putative [Bodo saltans]|eukprot:CUG87000.1 maf protein, putative [Bodo saltans]